MMIVHDERGAISQLIATGEFDLLEKRYAEVGFLTMRVEPSSNDVVAIMNNSYVAGGVIRARPNMTLEYESNVIDGIPQGCAVRVFLGGLQVGEATVDDGTMEFAPPLPGTYTLRFECWPYFPVEMEVIR